MSQGEEEVNCLPKENMQVELIYTWIINKKHDIKLSCFFCLLKNSFRALLFFQYINTKTH